MQALRRTGVSCFNANVNANANVDNAHLGAQELSDLDLKRSTQVVQAYT